MVRQIWREKDRDNIQNHNQITYFLVIGIGPWLAVSRLDFLTNELAEGLFGDVNMILDVTNPAVGAIIKDKGVTAKILSTMTNTGICQDQEDQNGQRL